MKFSQKKWLPLLCLVLAALMIFAVGCGGNDEQPKPDNQPANEQQNAGEQELEVTLYFSDDEAMYLLPEKRTITLESDDPAVVAKAVLEALIAGPETDELNRTMPEGTQVLAVDVLDSVANVDLNKAFKENHWGGSEGEIHTLYSVINTLAKNVGVTEVQFTIEGKIDESILGHIGTTEPLAPDFDLIKE